MFKTSARRFRTLREDDPDFCFSPDDLTLVPRAGFEISSGCPVEYKQIITTCIDLGWLKPVAHMRDTEYTKIGRAHV